MESMKSDVTPLPRYREVEIGSLEKKWIQSPGCGEGGPGYGGGGVLYHRMSACFPSTNSSDFRWGCEIELRAEAVQALYSSSDDSVSLPRPSHSGMPVVTDEMRTMLDLGQILQPDPPLICFFLPTWTNTNRAAARDGRPGGLMVVGGWRSAACRQRGTHVVWWRKGEYVKSWD